jgi:hypothetical protein
LSAIYCTPGPDNSNLINTENAVPNKPENKANIRYKVPMSLALDDKNHLSLHRDILDFIRFNSLFDNKLCSWDSETSSTYYSANYKVLIKDF